MRVPNPATGRTALRTRFIKSPETGLRRRPSRYLTVTRLGQVDIGALVSANMSGEQLFREGTPQ
jgi:hypothetical protein